MKMEWLIGFGALFCVLLFIIPSTMLVVHEKSHTVNHLKHGAKVVKETRRIAQASGDTQVVRGRSSQKPQAQLEILSGGLVGELRFVVLCFGAAGFFSSF